MGYVLCALLGLAGGFGFSRYQAHVFAREKAELVSRILDLQDLSGAACEPIYSVVQEDFDCPLFLGSKLPPAVKPMVCTRSEKEYRTGDLEAARARLSPGALLTEERGVKKKRLDVVWTPGVKR